jgi:hypothetical protein
VKAKHHGVLMEHFLDGDDGGDVLYPFYLFIGLI